MRRLHEPAGSASRVWTGVLLALVFFGSAAFLAAQEAPPPSPPTAVVEEPVADEPPAGPDLSAATERIRAGAYEEAEEILAGLRAEYPDDPALLLMHGEVLLALGRVEDARSALERSVELDPQRPRAHFQLATALASSGQVDRALDEFAREIETDPDVLSL